MAISTARTEHLARRVANKPPGSPVPANPRADAENGRGLLLVDAISERWGWYVPGSQPGTDAPGQHGKVVWAVVQ